MLFNNKTLAILSEFCSDYNKRIYGRQIAKKLKMNQKTVSNILNSLEKQHILKYATEGKNKYYFLNQLNLEIQDILKIIEITRKNIFLKKYPKLRNLFKELENRGNGILIVFGSYANNTSTKDSDLDIFTTGQKIKTQDLEEKYNLEINIITSTKHKFNKQEVFIKEVIKNHIILKGVEEFIDLTWQQT